MTRHVTRAALFTVVTDRAAEERFEALEMPFAKHKRCMLHFAGPFQYKSGKLVPHQVMNELGSIDMSHCEKRLPVAGRVDASTKRLLAL